MLGASSLLQMVSLILIHDIFEINKDLNIHCNILMIQECCINALFAPYLLAPIFTAMKPFLPLTNVEIFMFISFLSPTTSSLAIPHHPHKLL